MPKNNTTKSTNTNATPFTIHAQEAEKLTQDDVYERIESSEKGLSTKEAASRLKQCGRNAVEEKKKNVLLQLLKYFWGPIPWMIEIAAILSLVASDIKNFIIIMILLIFNALIGFFEEHKAGNALEALKKGLALKSLALRDGKWTEIEAATLVPGDIIKVRLGNVIPADSKLISGEYLSVDQAALTGESLPVNKKVGDVIYSGSIAKQGEMVAAVTATGGNTFFGKTAKLVAQAGNISHFQQAVMRVGKFLIVLAIILCLILISVVLYRDYEAGGINYTDILDLIKFVLILAVASIPVAMPAVLSITMALGALEMSRRKAIVARLQSIEEMAGVDILCSDKTGTLTKNELTIGDPLLFQAKDAQACILGGALASQEEDQDIIDLTIINGLKDKSELNQYKQTKFFPFDPVHKRTEATIQGPGNQTLRFAKGAPQVIIDMCKLDDQTKKKAEEGVHDFAAHGYRALAVGRSDDDGKTWNLLGVIPLFDPPRDDSAETIAQAKKHGLQIKMVTGDDVAIASEISGKLGMGTHIQKATDIFGQFSEDNIPENIAHNMEKADGFARVFPEHKYGIVKALQKCGHLVAMTGDGVNDAPALRQADAGIAVSGATDAARAAAALILTAPGLSVIIQAIEMARKIFERMMSYTIYRIAMTLDIMFFVVLSMLIFPTLPGTDVLFKPLTAIMIIILALLDDIPIMTIAFDNTPIDKNPVVWHMGKVISISSILGGLAIIETFVLLLISMSFLNHEIFGTVIKAEHLQTTMFLQLVVGGHLMLFVSRTKNWFFFRPWPRAVLFWAITGTQVAAALLCWFGWPGVIAPLPWIFIIYIWLYNIGWMFIQDIVKLITYKLMERKTER